VVKVLEMVAEPIKILITQGPAGLWEYIKDQLSTLKDTVIEGIKSFVTESIIKAGVTWIIGLLNPAGAFIKACKAIYDIVMFFVERGSQIITLVNAVVDSISAIANGATGVAAGLVENALSKALPVAISFLAALLGVSGITEKIRAIIAKVQAPVHKAIDWVIDKAVSLVKKAGKLLGFGKDKKDKDSKPDERTYVQKERDLNDAIRQAEDGINRPHVKAKAVESLFAKLKKKYRLTKLELQATKGFVLKVHGAVNPERDDSVKYSGADNIEADANKAISNSKNALKASPNKAFSSEVEKVERDIKATVSILDGTTGFDFFTNVEQLLKLKSRSQDLESQIKSGVTTPTGGAKSPAEIIKELLGSGKAIHISPSTYRKHWKGGTEAERRNSSENGDGQFLHSMSSADVEKLEREALLNPDRIEDKVNTYYAFKTFSKIIGYTNGKEAFTLRAEITAINSAKPFIHSHPR
jgi:hypothetical protein